MEVKMRIREYDLPGPREEIDGVVVDVFFHSKDCFGQPQTARLYHAFRVTGNNVTESIDFTRIDFNRVETNLDFISIEHKKRRRRGGRKRRDK